MKLSDLHKLTKAVTEGVRVNDPKQMEELLRSMGLDPNTFYQELEMTSTLVDTHRDVSYSNEHIQLHSHTFYELLYCRNTCGAEYLIGSERYRLMRGDLIYVPPGVSHRPLLPEKLTEPYKRYVVWMSPKFVENFAETFPDAVAELRVSAGLLRTGGTQWNENLAELFRKGVLEFEQKEDGWEAAVFGNTVMLLTQIMRAVKDRGARELQAEKPELLDRIMAVVESEFAADITLDKMAKELYVSSSTVSHLVKQKLGISFYRFVTQRRLIEAKKLIEKNVPLESVAVQVGFGDYSGFYRAFKQEYGISPRQYRNLQEQM